jgi:hypothetical protein
VTKVRRKFDSHPTFSDEHPSAQYRRQFDGRNASFQEKEIGHEVSGWLLQLLQLWTWRIRKTSEDIIINPVLISIDDLV